MSFALRAAQGSMTPLPQVLAWPWHKMVAVWAEARDAQEDTWGLLLKVWYKFDG